MLWLPKCADCEPFWAGSTFRYACDEFVTALARPPFFGCPSLAAATVELMRVSPLLLVPLSLLPPPPQADAIAAARPALPKPASSRLRLRALPAAPHCPRPLP